MLTFAPAREQTLADDMRPLRDGLRGELLTPDAPGYDEARTIWNARHDRRPAAVVRPACAEDVALAVRFARAHALPLAVRGGGHGLAGSALVDGGLVIDMRSMRQVRVDAAARTVRAEAGALAGELDGAANRHGLAVPIGTASAVGIGGLTLGGGIGWLSRTYGLTLDSLLAVELVTANGRVITASAAERPELFWGLRGGGGNFGAVTAFTYRAHPAPPEVLGGALLVPFERAGAALRLLRDVLDAAPDELSVVAALMTAPPAAPFPEPMWGRPALALDMCYAGPEAHGERAIRPLRVSGLHAVDTVRRIPFLTRQRSSDAKIAPGMQQAGTSRFLHTLSDPAIDALLAAFAQGESPRRQARLIRLGGAIGRVPADATAYAHRDAAYTLWLGATWAPGEPAAPHTAWLAHMAAAMAPHTYGAYVNVLDSEGEPGVRAAYGERTYERLRALKRSYDPQNIFRSNQNVRP